jgi:hypothetical protein
LHINGLDGEEKWAHTENAEISRAEYGVGCSGRTVISLRHRTSQRKLCSPHGKFAVLRCRASLKKKGRNRSRPFQVIRTNLALVPSAPVPAAAVASTATAARTSAATTSATSTATTTTSASTIAAAVSSTVTASIPSAVWPASAATPRSSR